MATAWAEVTEPVVAVTIPREGPYRVVLERLQRLVIYRQQLRAAVAADGDSRAGSELIRIGHMIREVHRAVSMNPAAKALADRLDP